MSYVLKLYIAGSSIRSQRAIQSLHEIFSPLMDIEYSLEIIDVLQQPELAEKAKILATPTLVLEVPPPKRRIVGDLSDRQQVLLTLNLVSETRDEASDEFSS